MLPKSTLFLFKGMTDLEKKTWFLIGGNQDF